MATASIDDYSSIPTAEAVSDFPDTFESTAPSQNLGLAILKRWPWIIVGVIGGVILGLLYHFQQKPVYQSSAQLLVIKNRPEMISGGTTNSLTFVEDYVTTQVTLLKSELILMVAASKLQENQFQNRPPASDKDRVGYMTRNFTVMREREAGSNQFTNVLALTFRSGNPGDSAQYLRAIIEAYRAQLATLYSEASTREIERMEQDIRRIDNERNTILKGTEKGKEGIEYLNREIQAITNEDLSSMRSRLTANVNDKLQMQKREAFLNRRIESIEKIGPNRSARMDLFIQYGGTPRQMNITQLDSRNPQDVLFSFQLQRTELSQKYGKDHPEIQSLDGRMRMLKELIALQAPEEKLQLDELAVLERTYRQERDTLKDQIDATTQQITQDEQKIKIVSALVSQKEQREFRLKELTAEGEKLAAEKGRMESTRTSGGYKVEDITKPTEGFQVAPSLYRSLLFGLFLGLIAGGGLALTMELTDRSFRSPSEIRRRLGLPILGHIPRLKIDEPAERPSATGIEPSLVSFYRPTSTEAEAYRGVRTQLYFSTQGRGHQVIQVTSPNPGDGKSTLAANLAISIAQSGKRVVLIDCDFRKPRVHKIFKLPKPDVGLASVMSGDAPLMTAVQGCEIENLSLMPCGPRPANPAELLTSPKFTEVLRDLRERFDFVIVDTPPVLAVSDPSAVAPRVDGVLLVFRMTKNARPLTERAREQLAAVGARMLGVIVNASAERSAGYGGYGYAYQYEYQYAESYTDQDQ